MEELLHFSDNLFFINEMIKSLNTACDLNLESSYFTAKISSDIVCITKTLDQIDSVLTENSSLRKNIPHIRTLLKTRSGYRDLIEKVTRNRPSAFLEDSSLEPVYENELKKQNTFITRLVTLLSGIDNDNGNEVFISPEELSLLLKE